MCEIVLIRPCSTSYDEQKRIQGRLDLPLSDHGQAELVPLIDKLRNESIEYVMTDPGEPSRSVAKAVAEALDIGLKEKSELQNLDQGLWQGLQLEEVRRKYPKLLKQWQESPEAICPPQGESISDAIERVEKVLKKPLKKGKRFAVVAAEPLASLVASVVSGTKLEYKGPRCSGGGAILEYLSTNGERRQSEDLLQECLTANGAVDNAKNGSTEVTDVEVNQHS
ncbi:Phosphoserine phosphatase 1 [Calycomorphotria hydatis]|uniref:phosphoglycerate mutase (2,3-diphosphoglycerate-dependent) n=2 Tax=Calycomorphotria hydatis TaxID=2528027 RepID=A0A517T7B8_9PLAN|nr:Phosphoserine phosphatase 1 [Calycomorphotria hydatis]